MTSFSSDSDTPLHPGHETVVEGNFAQHKRESYRQKGRSARMEGYSSSVKQLLGFEELLKGITDRVRDSLDEDTIIETTVRELCLALNVRCCNASLYDLTNKTSTVHYEFAAAIPASRGRVSSMEDFAECYQQLLDQSCFQMCSLRVSPERQRVSLLACPIHNDETVIGDLWLVDRADRGFSEYEIRLVKQVANQCAIAIRQARLYQTSQNQVQQLQQMHQLKDDFINTVSHELRTPLTSIKMALTMLQNQLPESQRQKYITMALQQCQREIELVNGLLDLQKFEQAHHRFLRGSSASVSLSPWLADWASKAKIEATQRGLTVEGPFYPQLSEVHHSVEMDRGCMDRILRELIHNACKYTPSGGTIQLCMRPSVGDRWELDVRNSVEIPAGDLDSLFDKFFRARAARDAQVQGTGLGLSIVKELVQLLAGTITITSQNGWTTVSLSFPQKVCDPLPESPSTE
ncbi:MAG: ATP-binding protein [Synechococcus sp.]